MTSLEAYQKLLEKVNRNDVNTNIHVPRGKFVSVFNEQQRNWLKNTLREFLKSDDLDEVGDLLVDYTPLENKGTHNTHVEFEIPKDFYRFGSAYCLATKGNCQDRPLVIWNVKSKNVPVLLQNDKYDPSFEYEETIGSIASGNLRVYTSDFSVTQTFMAYYRFAHDIDLEGYIKIDGTASTDIACELGDDMVEEILNLTAAEIMRNNQDVQGLQLAKDRPN